jgi:hypothetical protein
VDLAIIVTVLLLLFCGASGVFYLRRNNYVENEHSFSQAGITVDYTAQTIAILGQPYSIHAVRSVRCDGKQGSQSTVSIAVNDARNPVHKIGFATNDAAETFIQRFSTAILKAGGRQL